MTPDQLKMLDECIEAESGLSGWEIDFIENLDANFRGRELTDRQADKLEAINEKVIGG